MGIENTIKIVTMLQVGMPRPIRKKLVYLLLQELDMKFSKEELKEIEAYYDKPDFIAWTSPPFSTGQEKSE